MFTNLILPLAAVLLLGTGTAFAETDDKSGARAGHENPMAEFDADKDGAISNEESAAKAAKKFDEIDANKDGSVSLDEMDKYREAEKAKHEAKRAERAAEMKKKHQEKVDPDGDGKITKEEFMKGAAERHSKMDGNGDGKVTKEEMKEKFGEHRKGRGERMKPPVDGAAPADTPAEPKAE